MTLVEFLLARLDEDERVARAAETGWMRVRRNGDDEQVARSGWRSLPLASGAETGMYPETLLHAAIHDPARVLAEVEAKRKIVDEYTFPERPAETDAELHARQAHPAYEYDTTEGPRKAWDNENVPPEGDGWERNVDAGDRGWARFDYTEEAYWRRRVPADEMRTPRPPLTLRLLALPYADHPDYREEWRP